MSPRFAPSIPDDPARTGPPDDEHDFEREEMNRDEQAELENKDYLEEFGYVV